MSLVPKSSKNKGLNFLNWGVQSHQCFSVLNFGKDHVSFKQALSSCVLLMWDL